MAKNYLSVNISKLTAIVSVAVTASIGISFSAQAGPKLNVADRGAPELTAGAASRSSNSATLIALEAMGQETLTVANAPTVFIYVSDTNASEGIFVLKDEEDNDIGRVTVALPEEAGIVRVQLPESLMSETLQVGKPYQWVFSPQSENNSGINTTFITGWIQRTELSPQQMSELSNAEPLTVVDLYTEANLWSDALTTLADLRAANPNDATLEVKWNNLLTEAGLNTLAGTSVDFAQN
jgi:hypothetical protein